MISKTSRITPTRTSRDDYGPEASAGAASPTTKALAKTKTGRVGAAAAADAADDAKLLLLQPHEKRSNT